jgi:hypothetical protein
MRRHRASALFTALLAAGACHKVVATNHAAKADAAPAPTPAAAPVSSDPYGLRPVEKAAVEAFLAAHTDLRMALDADARSPDASLLHLYGVYHPYFVRGDVNDDGVLDFVMAFVRRDSPSGTPWFSVVVFAGREKGGYETGTFLERDISLADGDISVDRDAIVITPDTEDDPNRRYRWDAVHRQFRFVNDDEEPSETPGVTRTGLRVSKLESGAAGSGA